MRPPYYWNFFEEEDVSVPHVLRPEADPRKCYIDGRIESLLEDVERIGFHLTRNQEEKWKALRNFTVKIFKEQFKNEGHSEENKGE